MTLDKIFKYAIILFLGTSIVISCSTPEDDCIEKTWYQDADGDSFGDPDKSIQACIAPDQYVEDNTDFDDLHASAFPGASEDCNDQVDNDGNGSIDECILRQITGNWNSDFGEYFIINESSLTDTTNNNVFHVLDSGFEFVICQNGADNSVAPNLYSKFVFTNLAANSFNWCQSFYDSPSQMAIEDAAEPSNPNNLNSGCLGFAWSEMTRE